MPTKRTRATRTTAGQITADACEAWSRGDWHGVNRLLRVQPWQVSPFDATGPEPPQWAVGGWETPWAQSWPRAWELRQRLIELAGQPGRVGRHGEPLGPAH